MQEAAERYLRRVKGINSEGTYGQKRAALEKFDNWAADRGYDDLTELGPLEVEEFFIWMKSEGYAPNTIAVKYNTLHTFYGTLAGKFDMIEESPFEDLDRSDYISQNTRKHDEADIVYVTEEEKERLCENVPSPTFRNELIIRLMWQTGVRSGELAGMKLADLDRDKRSISVWSPKTKKSRTVFYQPKLDFYLEQWLDRGRRDSYTPAEDSQYLFITSRSEKLGKSTVNNKIVKPAAEKAGVQEVLYTDQAGKNRHRITAHALRHGHAVHALKKGIDVRTVKKHLGHSKLEMTMRYLQLIDDDVKEAYEGFGAAD